MNGLKKYWITGTVFVLLLGTLSHFLYDWSGHNFFVGLLTPVSESTWEHMKLLFFPMLLFVLLTPSKVRKELPGLVPALHLGILAGTALIPVFFYTYTGILGKDILWLDLADFFVSVITAFYTAYATVQNQMHGNQRVQSLQQILYLAVCLLFFFFVIFTYAPPALPLFQDPTI
jgi:hypothetical protein